MHYERHDTAIVESEQIGRGTHIGAYVRVMPTARVGDSCLLGDHTFIGDGVVMGNGVRIEGGVQIHGAVVLEDEVHVGSNVTFAPDPAPSGVGVDGEASKTLVRHGVSIGAGTTVLRGVEIGLNARVGAGSVITSNIPPQAIVSGNPTRITAYATVRDPRALKEVRVGDSSGPEPIPVRNVKLHVFPQVTDIRGSLSFAEYSDGSMGLPFLPVRYFLVYGVPGREVRGEHAHRTLHELLVCVNGSCAVVVDDGTNQAEIPLDRPNIALHLPPMTWTMQYKYTTDAVLLVLASDVYKHEDYIRDYKQFLAERGALEAPLRTV